MLNLNDREWKRFLLISKDMFYIDNVSTIKSTSEANANDFYDVVGATSKNNGNIGFLNQKDKSVRGNCICLIKTGQGSVGDAVYKKGDFIPSNNVCVIRSHWLNKHNGLFIVAEINRQANKYSYGYIRNNQRILKETVMLPSDKNGNPDYEFMEQYIKEQENRKREEYIQHIKNGLHHVQYKEIKKWEELEWKEFSIKDLFSYINIAKSSDYGKLPKGNNVFVGRTSSNNGVQGFVEKDTNEQGNCITISMVGDNKAFWQTTNFVTSQNILILRNDVINKFSGLFICSLLNNYHLKKFDYGNPIKLSTFPKERILLPVTDTNEPDYEYMEQYVKNNIYLRNIQYLIERGIENNNFKLAHVYSYGWGAVMGYVLPSSISPQEQIKEIMFKPHTGFMFEIKKRLLTITLNFEEVEKFDFYFSNLFCKEIATAINTGAIKIVFRTPKDEDMDEYSEGYSERTTIVLDYLTSINHFK